MKSIIKRSVLAAILTTTAFVTTGRAQQGAMNLTIYRVEVTLTRMDGAKTLGSSPYALLVNSTKAAGGNRASLRIGIEVPSGTLTNGGTQTIFKTVGTQIDCTVAPFDDTRYSVDVSISDTAVFSDGADAQRVADAQQDLELARRALERQKSLFSKNLTTQQTVDRATVNVSSAERALAIAGKPTKSLAHADQMAFRSFTSSNRVYLRDGETQEVTVATDRTSGETVRASVKLTVVK